MARKTVVRGHRVLQMIANRIANRPVILLLDNFEELLDSETQSITNTDVQQMLEALLELPQHTVKVRYYDSGGARRFGLSSTRTTDISAAGRRLEIALPRGFAALAGS